MEIRPDFSELLRLFADLQVEYAIVGGYAVAFHGAPRYTGDLNLLASTRPEYAERIMQALHEFGFADFAFTATPKNKTLEIFGEPDPQPDGRVRHHPFHRT